MSSLFNHAKYVDLFYEELLVGAVGGIQPRPALTRDVHALYRLWAERRGIPSLASPVYFVKALAERKGVALLRKRYVLEDSVVGPYGILYLVTPPAPPPGFEGEQLGMHVTLFASALALYRSTMPERANA